MRSVLAVFAATVIASSPARAAVDLIVNGGFETGSIAQAPGRHSSNTFAYPGGTYAGWTYASATGLIRGTGATAWYGSAPPAGFNGAQFAFLQTQNTGGRGTLSQTITANATGVLTIEWLEGARRFSGGNSGDQTYTVLLNDNLLGTFTSVSGQTFAARSVFANVFANSSYTIKFAAASGVRDETAFIDDVSATVTVPEPATWAMMIVGFAFVGGAMRRRAGVAVAA